MEHHLLRPRCGAFSVIDHQYPAALIPEYQQARRSLFEWEDQIVATGWPTSLAVKKLENT